MGSRQGEKVKARSAAVDGDGEGSWKAAQAWQEWLYASVSPRQCSEHEFITPQLHREVDVILYLF